GGQNLIDIKLRNDAIHIVHLATFLGVNGTTPRWALVMQDAMRRKVLSTYRTVNPGLLVNTFLQTWDANKMDLPLDMKRILRVAKENNLLMDALVIPPEVRGEMPIWLHQGWAADKIRRTNDKYAKCLQANHNVRTAEDARRVAEDEGDEPGECDSPNQCKRRAGQLLEALDPKWNPRNGQADAARDRTEVEKEQLPKGGDLLPRKEDLFRIFTEGPTMRGSSTHEPRYQINDQRSERLVCIVVTRNEYADEGVGMWLKTRDRRNADITPPEGYTDEIPLAALAVQRAIEITPDEVDLTFLIRSKRVQRALTTELNKNESEGWKNQKPAQRILLQWVVAQLRARKGDTVFRVENSTRHPGMKGAMELAKKAADKHTRGLPAEPAPRAEKSNALLTGVRLRGLTQKEAYEELKKKMKVQERRATEGNMERIKYALKDMNGQAPSREKIWRSVRGTNTSKKTQIFRWRAIHEAHATGDFFTRMENLGHLAMCPECGSLETLEHILLECEIGSHEVVWSTAKSLWERTGEKWPKIEYGTLLGCGAARPVKGKGTSEEKDGLNRLFQKLLSEGAFLLWKLRNKRRIENEDDEDLHQGQREVRNKYIDALKMAATTDFAMTNKGKFGKQAIPKKLVLNTW
ncbi:hypothetical protein BDZ89DRAFT_891217, partial [Hymenopellis radicata]